MVMKTLTPLITYNGMQPTLDFKTVHLAHKPVGSETLSCNMG